MYKRILGLMATLIFSAIGVAQETGAPGPQASPVAEGTAPSATLTLHGGAVAAGVGYVWGSGRLDYIDHHHRFKLKGISVVDVGAADITAVGEVYNLSRLSDFNGNYVAASAGATVGDGASVAYLKNEHGVIIKLHSTTVGLRFTLAADGVHIRLRRT